MHPRRVLHGLAAPDWRGDHESLSIYLSIYLSILFWPRSPPPPSSTTSALNKIGCASCCPLCERHKLVGR